MTSPSSQRYLFLQLWLLLAGIISLAVFVLYDQGLIGAMFDADRSYLSGLILIVFAGASGHAAWHIWEVSQILEHPAAVHHSMVDRYLEELRAAGDDADDRNLILEIYADRLRAPAELGWHLVDILIRLGLIGTIIGFILILGALANGPVPAGDNIQALLVTMSSGMGTALYTTLAGLVTASLLGLQYMILSRCVEHTIALLIQLRPRMGVAA